MGRPKGGTNVSHSKEEKVVLVKRMLAGESGRQLEKETGIRLLCRRYPLSLSLARIQKYCRYFAKSVLLAGFRCFCA